MKLLVTGAGGLLGTAVSEVVEGRGAWTLVPMGRAELDVTDADAVREALAAHRPDAVLHCAAWTAVDAAESHADAARRVNVEGTRHLAAAAARVGAVPAYVSTDFVFDGTAERPYRPDDPPAPLGVYGRTKLQGERATREEAPEHLVLRTGGLYGSGGRDFLDAVVGRARAGEPLEVVDDQVVAPTWARNAAAGMLELLESGARGTWHVQDRGALTWYDFARMALERLGFSEAARTMEAVSTDAYGAAAPRPRYSVLDCSATEARLGRAMPSCADALARYLEDTRQARPS